MSSCPYFDPSYSVTSQGGSPNDAPTPLNIIGNELWLATNYLLPYNSSTPDSLSFGIAMGAINNLMQYLKANPPAAGSYLDEIMADLTSTNSHYQNKSLADLAADYQTNGYSASDFQTFCSYVNDSSEHPFYQYFVNDMQNWGSHEGSFQPSPTSPATASFKRYFNSLLDNDFPLSSSGYQQFLVDVDTAQKYLSQVASPMDGALQSFQDLLNVQLSPGNANSTLSKLAANGNVNDLATYLTNNPTLGATIQKLMTEIKAFENW